MATTRQIPVKRDQMAVMESRSRSSDHSKLRRQRPEPLIKLMRTSWAKIPIPPSIAHVAEWKATCGFREGRQGRRSHDSSRFRAAGSVSAFEAAVVTGSCFSPSDVPVEYRDYYRSGRDPVCVDAPILGRPIKAAFDPCLLGDYSSHLL